MATAIGDIFRVAARLQYGGDDFVNVYHTKAVHACTDAQTVTGILEWLEAVYTPIIGVLHQGMGFVDVKIDKVEWLVGKETIVLNLGIYNWPTHTVGTGTGDPLPHAVSALVTLRTAAVKTIGRKFFGRSIEGLHDANGWTAPAIASLTSCATAIMNYYTDTNAFQWKAVVHSIRANDWVEFTAAIVRSVAAYQRRRKPGVGS